MSQTKKELLFSAVLRLITAGKPAGSLKVSEIAAEAGIGKGTVYEYFTSREELLVGAVEYGKQVVYESLVEGLRAAEHFDDRWKVVEDAARRVTRCGFILLRQLPELYTDGEATRLLQDPALITEQHRRMAEIEGYLAEAALADGLIPALPTPAYLDTAMSGCMGAYLLRIPQAHTPQEQQALMTDCRRLFLAALQ